ncbi:MAG: TIGR01459 family HAD-type hydrolase [Alphaproteobacteria bacterium]|nr:TIGR01459 family HAD-type hydrolase [Alphaproteobacteria bacterium]
MIAIQGLHQVADRYDGFILDLWGLIHDGETAYPPSAATLTALKSVGKNTLMLSNAPRRAGPLIDALARMGIERALYGEVLSSGDATRTALIERTDPFFAALGRRAYHLGPERDRSVFEGTELAIVAAVEDAELIVNTGPIDLAQSVIDWEPVLAAGAARRIPMVCANPDHVVIRGGKRVTCAGALAARYQVLGGSVAYRGKPDPEVYRLATRMLGIADPRRIAVVGDALDTDVKGAMAAGLDAIWCTGGIHAAELGVSYGVAAEPAAAASLAQRQGYRPTAIIPGFVW